MIPMPTATEAAYLADPNAKQQTAEFMRGVIERSTTDARFRTKLLSDSTAALAEHAGVPADKITGRINFVQHENAPMVVLPKFGADLTQLSENQLETVSGGTDPFTLGVLFVEGVILGVEAGVIIYEVAKAKASS
jgi:hypothetical protein